MKHHLQISSLENLLTDIQLISVPVFVVNHQSCLFLDCKNFIEFRTIEELYDLSKDPGCRNNLVGEPSYQKILNKLRKRMLNILRKTNDHELKNFQILLN